MAAPEVGVLFGDVVEMGVELVRHLVPLNRHPVAPFDAGQGAVLGGRVFEGDPHPEVERVGGDVEDGDVAVQRLLASLHKGDRGAECVAAAEKQ